MAREKLKRLLRGRDRRLASFFLFLTLPLVCLQFVIVEFTDHFRGRNAILFEEYNM